MSDILAMKNILEAMNGTNNSGVVNSSLNKNLVDADGVDAMKVILERMNKASEDLVMETAYDRPLREAMSMEESENGVVIGNWNIVQKDISGRKLYDVFRNDDMNAIASDLTLYEAAHGLVTALNDGLPITSKYIRELLRLEECYATAVHDAIHTKCILKKRKLTESRQEYFSDKYQGALYKARDAREYLIKMVNRYPIF